MIRRRTSNCLSGLRRVMCRQLCFLLLPGFEYSLCESDHKQSDDLSARELVGGMFGTILASLLWPLELGCGKLSSNWLENLGVG